MRTPWSLEGGLSLQMIPLINLLSDHAFGLEIFENVTFFVEFFNQKFRTF